jgi:hypothetical protein
MSVVQLMTPEYKHFVTHFPGIEDRAAPPVIQTVAQVADVKPEETPAPKKKKAPAAAPKSGRPDISAAKKKRKN